jgi:imidazolonepropionase-like amidohydrolase
MTLVVHAGTVIANPLQAPLRDAAVVVDEGRIAAIGPAGELDLPQDIPRLDWTHGTALPGLVDTHLHTTANLRLPSGLAAQFAVDDVTAVARGVENLRSDLDSGVTTVRTLGDRPGFEVRFRELVESGRVAGPRMQVCARALRPSHGTARFLAHAADGPERLRQRVRENYNEGANWIKLFVTNLMHGEGFEDYLRGDLTDVPAYTRAEIEAVVDEAHRLGIGVAVHAIGGDAMRWSIEAGVDSIEHANLMIDSDVELFTRHGSFLSDPNLALFFDEEVGFPSHASWDLPWWREKVERAREATARFLPEAVEAGVKVCLAGDSLHAILWREAELLGELGVSAPQALAAITSNGAALLEVGDELGTLEPGKRADLVCVSGDPLDDLGALAEVGVVIKDGEIVGPMRAPFAGTPAASDFKD